MSATETAMCLRVEDTGALRKIILMRPDCRNALDLATVDALHDALTGIVQSEHVEAVLLLGDGGSFCSGADLAEYAAQLATGSDFRAFARHKVERSHDLIYRLALLPVPTVVALTGAVAGGGLSLALAADVRMAGCSASVHLAWPKVNLAPDMGSSLALSTLLGPRAVGLLFTQPTLTSREALAAGLVDQVHPDADLLARAVEQALILAGTSGRAALAATKRLLRDGGGALRAALDAERSEIEELLAAPEFARAILPWRDRTRSGKGGARS